jgi:PAS domain S-box-containing protein
MKIKTKLQLIIIAVVILMAGNISLNFLWQRQAERQSEQELLVMELNGAIFERSRLREEYFLFQVERSKMQFLFIHKEIGKLLERMSGTFTRTEENVYFNNMRGFHTKIGEFFNKLVRLDESAAVHTAATQELRQRIISQMLVNEQSLYLEGFQLLKAANETTAYQNNRTQLFSNIIFGLLGLFVVSFAVIIIRSITHPLTRLHKGTEIIARGNLDYKSDIRTKDEIGQLSQAFDNMVANLKQTTISRDHLASEVQARKIVEDKLRESEEWFRNLFEKATDGIFFLSGSGEIVAVNESFAAMHGYSVAEILKINLKDLETPESNQLFPERVHRILSGENLIFEVEHHHKNGHLFPIEVTAGSVKVGSENYFLASHRDITERRQAENRATQLGRLKQELLGAGTLPAKLNRITRGVVEIYGADFARIWIVAPADLCDQGCVHAAVKDGPNVCRERERCLHLMASSGRYLHLDGDHRRVPLGCYKIGRVASGEDARFITNDVVNDPRVHNREWARSLGLASFAGFQLVSADGRPIGVLAFFSRQPILPHEYNFLEDIAYTTSRVILAGEAEERIRSALIDLERSNKDLEQFAYVASHDLQEPLRMVSSYTQLLAQHYEGRLDEKAKKFMDYAVDGAVRMQRLINDLLTYSRVGTRGKSLETTDTHALLGEAIRNLAAIIEEKRAIITNDDLPTVRADASQLMQVFQNLISNAVKFQGANVPHIHVSAQDKGREWVFSIRDNGIGIDKQFTDRIFIIFQRLHTRQEYPGTGIGLAVCKRIVERHGGRMWFESEPGKGSTFFFTITK